MSSGELRAAAPKARVPLLGFFVGRYIYALPLERLREVVRIDRLRRLPGAPTTVAGLVNLHGEIVCAVNPRELLHLGPAEPLSPEYLLVLRDVSDPTGLAIESISDIYDVDPAALSPVPPTWPAPRRALVAGLVESRHGSMALLDVDRLVATL